MVTIDTKQVMLSTQQLYHKQTQIFILTVHYYSMVNDM